MAKQALLKAWHDYTQWTHALTTAILNREMGQAFILQRLMRSANDIGMAVSTSV